MGRTAEDIRRRIMELAGSEPSTIQATVKEVNEEEFTCKVDLGEGLMIEDVRLRSIINKNKKGFCFIPTLESIVLISRIRGANEFYVSMFSEIDKYILSTGDTKWTLDQEQFEVLVGENEDVKLLWNNSMIEFMVKTRGFKIDKDGIILNGGQKGSYLTDINQLVSKINRIENGINGLKQILTAWVPVPMDGGAVLKAAVTAWAAQLIQPITSVNDLKDDKVKH